MWFIKGLHLIHSLSIKWMELPFKFLLMYALPLSKSLPLGNDSPSPSLFLCLMSISLSSWRPVIVTVWFCYITRHQFTFFTTTDKRITVLRSWRGEPYRLCFAKLPAHKMSRQPGACERCAAREPATPCIADNSTRSEARSPCRGCGLQNKEGPGAPGWAAPCSSRPALTNNCGLDQDFMVK